MMLRFIGCAQSRTSAECTVLAALDVQGPPMTTHPGLRALSWAALYQMSL